MSLPAREPSRPAAAVSADGPKELPTVLESADASIDGKNVDSKDLAEGDSSSAGEPASTVEFRVYKKRWLGLIGLVRFLSNHPTASCSPLAARADGIMLSLCCPVPHQLHQCDECPVVCGHRRAVGNTARDNAHAGRSSEAARRSRLFRVLTPRHFPCCRPDQLVRQYLQSNLARLVPLRPVALPQVQRHDARDRGRRAQHSRRLDSLRGHQVG